MFIGGHINWSWLDCDLVLPYLMWYEHNWIPPPKKKIKEKECSRHKYINASNNISSYNIVHDSVIEVKF